MLIHFNEQFLVCLFLNDYKCNFIINNIYICSQNCIKLRINLIYHFMAIFRIIMFFVAILSVRNALGQDKKYVVHTIAFYNIENFYDTINDLNTRDDEWVYSKKYYATQQAHCLAWRHGEADGVHGQSVLPPLARVALGQVFDRDGVHATGHRASGAARQGPSPRPSPAGRGSSLLRLPAADGRGEGQSRP